MNKAVTVIMCLTFNGRKVNELKEVIEKYEQTMFQKETRTEQK